MYICVCYELKESDFASKEEMIHHILHETSPSCGTCQDYILDVVLPSTGTSKAHCADVENQQE